MVIKVPLNTNSFETGSLESFSVANSFYVNANNINKPSTNKGIVTVALLVLYININIHKFVLSSTSCNLLRGSLEYVLFKYIQPTFCLLALTNFSD